MNPALVMPRWLTRERMCEFFAGIQLDGAPAHEMRNYWTEDWPRFVYTYNLAADLAGDCLELGANPYFTTTLLKYFTPLRLTLANYFGPHFGAQASQEITAVNPHTGERETHEMLFHHFNIEQAQFPFGDAAFDVVLFCEVIEHLQSDPMKVLVEIKRVLRPGGRLIVTTPNVARLENVARLVAGENIYDPYSGYGPYGRHNREYNRHEVAQLLEHCGFAVETSFTADVHENRASNFFPVDQITPLLESRAADLGQYLFFRARNATAAKTRRPNWLYRSYPAAELE